jgi:hypothetical protein
MCATASTPERQRDISGAASHVLLNQLPELYAGLQRDPTGFPVQYLGATYLRPGPRGHRSHYYKRCLEFSRTPRAENYTLIRYFRSGYPDVMLTDLRLGGGDAAGSLGGDGRSISSSNASDMCGRSELTCPFMGADGL